MVTIFSHFAIVSDVMSEENFEFMASLNTLLTSAAHNFGQQRCFVTPIKCWNKPVIFYLIRSKIRGTFSGVCIGRNLNRFLLRYSIQVYPTSIESTTCGFDAGQAVELRHCIYHQ
ncbi:13398_t:CDS:2 [Funneliformis caledonium]|uniref:13398_t:CDS:1 n=1 Tax=Funneliformis caledonium TaxID=1117310 RepID=A0A9N9D2T2_9GLOM|nr:13398_t:CDS:2 [Funneliformis caledonium]